MPALAHEGREAAKKASPRATGRGRQQVSALYDGHEQTDRPEQEPSRSQNEGEGSEVLARHGRQREEKRAGDRRRYRAISFRQFGLLSSPTTSEWIRSYWPEENRSAKMNTPLPSPGMLL